MFNDPHWPLITALKLNTAHDDAIIFAHTVQRFIASAQLHDDDHFDVDALARSLTALLRARGSA